MLIKYIKALSNIFCNKLATLTCDITCSKLYRDRKSITDENLS